MSALLAIEDLWKSFTPSGKEGRRTGVGSAARGITFSVEQGEVFGLIGPDGAGKTTLMRMLATLLLPNGGRGRLADWDLVTDYRKIRPHLGYMPGVFSLYQDLSVEENIRFFATLFNSRLRKNFHLISDVYAPLAPYRKRMASALSGGMKQKLALCCALIHRPMLLLLDEPTTGVDPVSRGELWQSLKGLAKQGVTIVVSTAYMDEASMCDRIAFMREGDLLLIDTPSGVISRYREPLYSVVAQDKRGSLQALRAMPFVTRCVAFGDTHHVNLKPGTPVTLLREALAKAGYTEALVTTINPSVEDCFMAFAEV